MNNLNRTGQVQTMELDIAQLKIPQKESGRIIPMNTDFVRPEILFITSFPPRECGIATYSQDLIKALNNKFDHSFNIQICALESRNERHMYPVDIKYFLNTDEVGSYANLAQSVNQNEKIEMVLIQHEFGFFNRMESEFNRFLHSVTKPVVMVFHTVLPHPNDALKNNIASIALKVESFIVMTNTSAEILRRDYSIPAERINIIPHGTHLVQHSDKIVLKEKYQLEGRKILSTFGLLSSGKSIETTLEAMPGIISIHPDALFLIIGKTHPTVVKEEGEQYREKLEAMIQELHLEKNVQFVNYFLPLPELLEYLQLTDVYLFTSRDPHQAVSGTFSYAISCGCPIISTPIPHAMEVLQDDAGIIVDFRNPDQLGEAVIRLLDDEQLRKDISSNGLHRMASTAWENSAIAHAHLFQSVLDRKMVLKYNNPETNLSHVRKMTTEFGIIQFSRINQPDICSGYTLDDNARAMIAMCQHFELTRDTDDLTHIKIYLGFINHCLQPEGYFLNYVDENKMFTDQNNSTNLADANGRAIWALGFLISLNAIMPPELIENAETAIQRALRNVHKIHSTRAMAFIIKGLYYRSTNGYSVHDLATIKSLANRLVQMFRHEADKDWNWYESYLTYANSILPEALLCAWLATGDISYKEIAKSSFDFLLSKSFENQQIKVISNKGWLHKGEDKGTRADGGEQPIDVAYTIIALSKFYNVFKDQDYMKKIKSSFNWFLGNNHLRQVIYNPCTGGCYDGLEENYVNLNQGAESTVSYLMARLTVEKYLRNLPVSRQIIRSQSQYALN